jgi:ribosomal protein S18 acetylase RimI-like enzyme
MPPYVKRHRMEAAPLKPDPSVPLPPGFAWLAWDDRLLEAHADVLLASFAAEPDAELFPNLGRPDGCRRLMRAVRDADGFCPAATWLIVRPGGCVGTIQGLIEGRHGMIQNVGVDPACRNLGLGRALVRKALAGFAAGGAVRAYLDVTAQNAAAVRLYKRLGFRRRSAFYKQVPRPEPVAAGL